MKKRPRILFLVPESYVALQTKGVAHMIFERDENGFFEKVFTVHPIAFKNKTIHLNHQHILQEFNLRKFLYPNKKNVPFIFFPLAFCSMIFQLLRLIKKEQIDIIRATDPYLMGLIAWILSKISGKPFCISIHADYKLVFALSPQKGFKQFLRFSTKWIPDFISPKASLIFSISRYLKKAISSKVKDENIRITYHGIDFSFKPIENIREKLKLPNNKKIISCVARLSKDKYIEDIISVIERLSCIRQDFLVVIVGGGELESYVKEWISHHPSIQSNICMLGPQPNPVGRSLHYISEVSLCLLGGFSLIEAAAGESPLISYDVEWHSELVETKKTGFLIREHDLDSLTDAICYLLDHPDEAKMMGVKARIKAYHQHDVSKTSQIKRKCYLELLNELSN